MLRLMPRWRPPPSTPHSPDRLWGRKLGNDRVDMQARCARTPHTNFSPANKSNQPFLSSSHQRQFRSTCPRHCGGRRLGDSSSTHLSTTCDREQEGCAFSACCARPAYCYPTVSYDDIVPSDDSAPLHARTWAMSGESAHGQARACSRLGRHARDDSGGVRLTRHQRWPVPGCREAERMRCSPRWWESLCLVRNCMRTCLPETARAANVANSHSSATLSLLACRQLREARTRAGQRREHPTVASLCQGVIGVRV